MPRYFPTLLGNDAVRDRLGRALCGGVLPHALILSGQRGSGRYTLALLLAAALVCERGCAGDSIPCGECNSCRRVHEGIYPDLHVIAPEEGKTLIPVAKIREMRAEMALSPVEGGRRIFIIRDAERMNTAAQNALLISLEEPPDGVTILLLTESEEALLTTVRSRCQTVRTELFEVEALRHYLEENPRFSRLCREDPSRADALLEGAHGTIGGALALLEGNELSDVLSGRERVDAIVAALSERTAAPLYAALHPLASTKREELLALFTLLTEALRDLILLKRAESAPLLYYTDRAVAVSAAERIGMRRLFVLADAVDAAAEDLSLNANVPVVISTLLYAAVR